MEVLSVLPALLLLQPLPQLPQQCDCTLPACYGLHPLLHGSTCFSKPPGLTPALNPCTNYRPTGCHALQGVQTATGAAGAALSGAAGIVAGATNAATNLTLGAVQGASQVRGHPRQARHVQRSAMRHIVGSAPSPCSREASSRALHARRSPTAALLAWLPFGVRPQIAGAVQGIVDVGKAIG